MMGIDRRYLNRYPSVVGILQTFSIYDAAFKNN